MQLRSLVPSSHPSAPYLGEERVGVGVALAPDRVLTAHYLVMGASGIELTGPDGRVRGVERASLDHESGFAWLATAGEPLAPAPLGCSTDASPGTPVFVVTWTREGRRESAWGHVSAVAPFEAFWEYMLDRALFTTILNPGLAGAPLFDAAGRVLGIVSLSLTAVAHYSLAIPIDLFAAQREALESNQDRRPRRAWLGLFPRVERGGVVVSGVVEGSPADQAGVETGDLLLSVDGQPVASLAGFYQEIWRKGPGEAVRLQLLRGSAIHAVEITAGDRYDFYR